MLLKLIFSPIFALLNFILGLIPSISFLQGFDIVGIFDIAVFTFVFFPFSVFSVIIGNVVFWLQVQGTWSIVEWVYKKIPGVN
jgi:hypothetical protein